MARATVLVVEDDAVLLDGLRDSLALAGYDVLTAGGGREALAELERHQPDLIVSDILMPDMDGYALLAAVRARPGLALVPFVFLTARDAPADVRAGMGLGADDYLTKPFAPDDLLAAIASRLRRRQQMVSVEREQREALTRRVATLLHHELRTPLAELTAYAELLEVQGGELGAVELDELLHGLQGGVERLGRTVADFLLLTDLETGRAAVDYELRRRAIGDVGALVAQAVDRHDAAAARRGIDIALRRDDRLPVVEGDPVYLADAVGRVLDNAVKFSPGGGEVAVGVTVEADRLRIAVADHGAGISPEALATIFEPLRQVDRERQEQQGAGNGLAICRGLVRLHGGEVRVTSAVGQGTTFVIDLPVAGAAPPPRRPPADARPAMDGAPAG